MNTRAMTVLALVLAGCRIGPDIDELPPANGAHGAETSMRVEVAGGTVTQEGELVAVRSDDFLVLTDAGLVRIPHASVRSAEFEEVRPGRISQAGTERQRETLAEYSRYPVGLTDDQLDRLLAAMGQDQLLRPRQ